MSGIGSFVDDYRGKLVEDSTKAWLDSPSTWDKGNAEEQWEIIKQSAKDAGMSVLEWFAEVAFKGSQNPEGMAQEALGAASYPFRQAAEVSFDYLNPWSTVDEQGSPVGLMHSEQMPEWLRGLNDPAMQRSMIQNPGLPLAAAMLGGLGIGVNKWAEGEDVLKGDLVAAGGTLAGPMVAGAVKGAGKVAQKLAPDLSKKVVDESRRKFMKVAGITTGMLAVPAIGAKAILKAGAKGGAKVKLGASVIGRNLTSNFFGTIGTLLKQAQKGIDENFMVKGVENMVAVYDTAGMKLSPASLVRLGTEERNTLSFFEKLKEVSESDLGIFPHTRALRSGQRIGRVDPETGHPFGGRPSRLDDTTLVRDMGGTGPSPAATLELDAKRLELHGIGRSDTLRPYKWRDLEVDEEYIAYIKNLTKTLDPTLSQESVDAVNVILRKFNKNVRNIEDRFDIDGFFRTGDQSLLDHLDKGQKFDLTQQYNVLHLDRENAVRLANNMQQVKWGMAHLEHLEKTNPERLIEILTDIAKVGEKAVPSDIAASKIAKEMLESLEPPKSSLSKRAEMAAKKKAKKKEKGRSTVDKILDPLSYRNIK